MSRRTRRHGSGGRTGQHFSATPNLPSYSQPPAGPVTVTRADGTVDVQAPQKAVRSVPKPRRKKPQAAGPKPLRMPTMKQLLTVECPSCGRGISEPCTIRQGHRARVELYRASAGQRSTPEQVREAVQKGVEAREAKAEARRQPLTDEERARRAAQADAAKEASRRKGSRGNPYKSANTRAVPPDQVMARRCRRCGAAPGVACPARLRNGTTAFHLERVQDARRELQSRLTP
ncbi:hypothetical protein ACIBAC_00010 [Streptomyces sp. NPDC051362]|uniref:hypothetical protein n=1 Tax=Streptomyces sp. NPDC051362 TaxID=3365651 RepID=UPI0037B2F74F